MSDFVNSNVPISQRTRDNNVRDIEKKARERKQDALKQLTDVVQRIRKEDYHRFLARVGDPLAQAQPAQWQVLSIAAQAIE